MLKRHLICLCLTTSKLMGVERLKQPQIDSKMAYTCLIVNNGWCRDRSRRVVAAPKFERRRCDHTFLGNQKIYDKPEIKCLYNLHAIVQTL